MKESQTLSVIETLYRATMDAALWKTAIQRTVEAVGGCAGTIHVVDHTSGEFEYKAWNGFDLEAAYNNPSFYEWPKHDVWTARTVPNEPDGAVLVGTKYVPAAEFHRTFVYNELARPLGWDWRDFIGLAPRLTGNFRAVFLAYRSTRQEDFGLAELDLMNQLRPHILTALNIDRRFGELSTLVSAMEAALDERADAMLFLDRLGRVIHCNSRARHLCEGSNPVLTLQAAILHIRDPHQDRKLQRLLAPSLSKDAEVKDAPKANASLVWDDIAMGRRFTLRVTPNLRAVAANSRRLGLREPAAIVSISDLRPRAERIAARMREAFALTAAEAAVVSRLLEGARLANICAETGVAMSTVRSQLKAIFQKTGVTSQADLIRVALTGF